MYLEVLWLKYECNYLIYFFRFYKYFYLVDKIKFGCSYFEDILMLSVIMDFVICIDYLMKLYYGD